MKRRGDDAGSTHVLEAVIIATIMVCSVVYVATFQSPPTGANDTRAGLQQRASDALSILAETPAGTSAFGDTKLAAYVAECMQGNCTNMSHEMHQLLPPGTSWSLSLSNGYDTFPVYGPQAPPGEAVTSSHLLEPAWSYTFAATGQSLVNPGNDPLYTYTLPIFDSNVLDQGGSPLRVLLHGTTNNGGSNFTLSASATTQALSTTSPLQPAASLYFLDPYGNPVGAYDVSNLTLDPVTHLANGSNVAFRVRLNETANISISAGAELRLAFPRAWNASASAALNPAWTLVQSSAADYNGSQSSSDIVARLAAPLRNGTADFLFNATYHGDAVGDYLFHATMSRGVLAEGNLVLRADTTSKTGSSFATPILAASVPRPMGGNTSTHTLWTIGLAIPTSTAVNIQSIEIVEQDGRAIFGNATLVSGGGSVSGGGDRLTWNAPTGTSSSFASIVLDVTPTAVIASPSVQRSAFVPPMTVANFTGRYIEQAGAGLWRQAVLPGNSTYGGYDASGGVGLGLNHSLVSNSIYKGISINGSVNYTVSNTSALSSASYGSYVGVERRDVPAGQTAIVDIDVQSLLFTLSQAGQSAGVTLKVYPPWSGASRTPLSTQTSFDTELLQSDVVSMTLLDVNGDGYPDPVLGTSNGRILALHGLTGGRIQGDVFLAPASPQGNSSTAPSITLLSQIVLYNQTDIVAATDQGSVFVLDKSLHSLWSWYFPGGSQLASAVAMDTARDIDGDGRPDIAVGMTMRANNTGVSTNAIYVLRANASNSALVAFDPIDGPNANGPLFDSVGQPNAVVGLTRIGQGNGQPGVAMTYQYTPGVAGVTMPNLNSVPPNAGPTNTIMLPRAGLEGVGADGKEKWLLAGTPVTVASPYDWNGDGIPDIVGGSAGGFVYMANGSEPTAAMGSTLATGATEVVSATHHDKAHGAYLTRDGTAAFTVNGWISSLAIGCPGNVGVCALPAGLSAIAQSGPTSFWLVGKGNIVLKSDPATSPAAAQYVSVSTVFPNAYENGLPVVLDPNGVQAKLFDYTDVSFGYGDAGNRGTIIGSAKGCAPPLTTCPTESLVMSTTDGGATWNVNNALASTLLDKSGGTVLAPLTRINFTTPTQGWIVGAGGTLLRTLDGGATWKGLDVAGTTVNLNGVACAPDDHDRCIVVGDAGNAWLTTQGTSNGTVTWTALPLPVASTKNIMSVGLVNDSVAYIGTQNAILESWDGGHNWSALPLSYVPGNGDVATLMNDGSGYLFGGTVATQRTFMLGMYNLTSHAQTTNLIPGNTIPAGATVNWADLEVSDAQVPASTPGGPSSTVSYSLSTDGGQTWTIMAANGTLDAHLQAIYPKAGSHLEWGNEVFDYIGGYLTSLHSTSGDLRLRMDFATTPDMAATTPYVARANLTVRYVLNGVTSTTLIPVDFNSTSARDASGTDAVWVPGMGGVHQPLARSIYWLTNVSGAVFDLAVGPNVTGDARPDVYVATGNILADNNPDSIPYATNAYGSSSPASGSVVTGDDDRVYLLDGANGSIVATSAKLPGNVTHIAISDANGDGVPEYVYATTWNGATAALYNLNPFNLTENWHVAMGSQQVSALGSDSLRSQNATAVVAERQGAQGGRVAAGRAQAFVGWNGATAWSAVPDQQGHYTVDLPVGRDWLFGPYVVEAAVDWNTTAYQVGSASPTSLVQTERFFDYFEVTPPDALSPPSPVYNVQLTVWYDDWR